TKNVLLYVYNVVDYGDNLNPGHLQAVFLKTDDPEHNISEEYFDRVDEERLDLGDEYIYDGRYVLNNNWGGVYLTDLNNDLLIYSVHFKENLPTQSTQSSTVRSHFSTPNNTAIPHYRPRRVSSTGSQPFSDRLRVI
ncbi:MAG: hypothetical protein ACC656_02685, partial [Candidatus Heimdallarchaeota archaeon]